MSNNKLTFCHNFFLKSCNKRKYPKNILTYLLEKYPDKDWLFGKYGISSNPSLTLEFIEKYPDKPWYWGEDGISSNPNITLEWIEKYQNKPWSFGSYGISRNPNITKGASPTLELIEKYPDKPWCWGQGGISSNPNITKGASMSLELIKKYPDKHWDWDNISYNPCITLEIIEYFKNKIDFKALSRNTFKYHNKKVKIISEKIKLFHYLSFSKMIYDIKRHIVTTFRKKL